MIHSDLHIHSENSYDASAPLDTIAQNALAQGLRMVGITDHVNFNDNQFLQDLRNSANAVKNAQKTYPFMIPGVELTPIEKPEFDYIAKTGTREGYEPPIQDDPYDIELAVSKEELMALGVRYAIGACHWRVDRPHAMQLAPDLDACIKEYFRQQMWLACDERVTILGHPWFDIYSVMYKDLAFWYKDFALIPRSVNLELAAALKENGKYVECNSHFFTTNRTTEKFRHQYAEFLRELFEMGIPVTYGSDSHQDYPDRRPIVEEYLAGAGFRDGDISELSPDILW